MRLLKATGRNVLDLFVVDARFTLALALWIAATASVPLLAGGHDLIAAIVFSAGFMPFWLRIFWTPHRPIGQPTRRTAAPVQP
jgi:hypothetical protein